MFLMFPTCKIKYCIVEHLCLVLCPYITKVNIFSHRVKPPSGRVNILHIFRARVHKSLVPGLYSGT